MTDLPISEELAVRLRRLAENENRALEAVLSDFVSERQHKDEQTSNVVAADKMVKDPLLLIAQAADDLGDHSESGNIAEFSREVLTLEYAEHLKRRLAEQPDAADE
jgi:hypothetical protein